MGTTAFIITTKIVNIIITKIATTIVVKITIRISTIAIIAIITTIAKIAEIARMDKIAEIAKIAIEKISRGRTPVTLPASESADTALIGAEANQENSAT